MADRKSFLERTAYKPGEFVRQQQLFDEAADRLARHMEIPVGNALRAEIVSEVAEEWTRRAKEALDLLLDSQNRTPDLAPETKAFTLELRDRLLTSEISDDSLQSEIRATCRELSQVVLARWYEVLGQAKSESYPVPLNPSLLPGANSTLDIFQEVDFSLYGATVPEVVAGFHSYRNELTRGLHESQKPWAVGTRLFMVSAASDRMRPYLLFGSEQQANEAARASKKAKPKKPAPILSFNEVYVLVGNALLGKRIPLVPVELAADLYQTSSYLDVMSNTWSILDDERRTDFRRFGEVVVIGIDAISSAYAVSAEEAEIKLREYSGVINSELSALADSIQLSHQDVTRAYALTVGTALEAYYGRLDPFVDDGAHTFADVTNDFVQLCQVTKSQAAELSSASMVGLTVGLRGFRLRRSPWDV